MGRGEPVGQDAMKEPPVCDDKERLMTFLYGECDRAERDLVERHLAACPRCNAEVEGLRGVRSMLERWREPEQALGFRLVRDEPPRRRSFWPRVPAWAQLAAAVLVLSVGAAIANLDVSIGRAGVTVRTGWQTQAPTARATSTPAAAPWQADLAALRQEMQAEIDRASSPVQPQMASLPLDTPNAAPAGQGISDSRLQTLLAEHDQQQRDEFERLIAQRFLGFARDLSLQQQADLMRVQRGFAQFQGRTSADLAQLRQVMQNQQNYLLRVGQIQEIK
jgi:hypothetical protein